MASSTRKQLTLSGPYTPMGEYFFSVVRELEANKKVQQALLSQENVFSRGVLSADTQGRVLQSDSASSLTVETSFRR